MPVALWRPLWALAPLAAAAALAACDAAPGFPAEAERPTLAAVQIAPAEDSLETGAPTATIPLTVEAEVGGAMPVEVRVLVRYAEADSLVAEATVEVEAPGAVRVEAPFTVSRGATGDYRVQVVTEGPDGRTGDGAAAVVQFAAASLGPPTVTSVEIASPITRTSGTVREPIVATVTDPDGVPNVAVVALIDPETGGIIGRLFDRGDADGGSDEAAGDGQFTAELQIFSDTPLGTYTLAVVAVDRAGEQSDVFPFTFTVE
jgi:hypothetical protein